MSTEIMNNSRDKNIFFSFTRDKTTTCYAIDEAELLDTKRKYYSNSNLRTRLFKKIQSKPNPNFPKPCQEYTGYVNRDGYGQIYVFNKQEYAHKISYCLHHNMIIEDVPLKDDADNRLHIVQGKDCSKLCIEPTHLSLEIHNEERDRKCLRGENHKNSKITLEQATAIKHSKGDGTQKERAAKYGVSLSIVNQIDSCQTWAYIPDKNGLVLESAPNRVRIKQKKREKTADNKKKIFNDQDWADALLRLKSKSIEEECPIKDGSITTPCHTFQGSLINGRYGQMSFRGCQYISHILAYQAKHKSKDVTQKIIVHQCGNIKCCNPDHLEQKA
jgi:hypothetical protein